MGCFNQSCNLTHVDINDDDVCMMLPILRNSKENGGYESLNDRCFRYYKPFCLPITGTYDHYGRITKIRKDDNTALIEKYFEISIEDFIECIAGRDDMYGQYSAIQKAYGHPNISLTVEDLAKIHFKTNDDKVIIHPHIEHINKHFGDKCAKENKPFIPIKIFWKDEKTVVIQSMNYKDELHEDSIGIAYKGGEYYAGNDFLKHIHRIYQRSREKFGSWLHDDQFIFGIPSLKPARAYVLMKLTGSFMIQQAY